MRFPSHWEGNLFGVPNVRVIYDLRNGPSWLHFVKEAERGRARPSRSKNHTQTEKIRWLERTFFLEEHRGAFFMGSILHWGIFLVGSALRTGSDREYSECRCLFAPLQICDDISFSCLWAVSFCTLPVIQSLNIFLSVFKIGRLYVTYTLRYYTWYYYSITIFKYNLKRR